MKGATPLGESIHHPGEACSSSPRARFGRREAGMNPLRGRISTRRHRITPRPDPEWPDTAPVQHTCALPPLLGPWTPTPLPDPPGVTRTHTEPPAPPGPLGGPAGSGGLRPRAGGPGNGPMGGPNRKGPKIADVQFWCSSSETQLNSAPVCVKLGRWEAARSNSVIMGFQMSHYWPSKPTGRPNGKPRSMQFDAVPISPFKC